MVALLKMKILGGSVKTLTMNSKSFSIRVVLIFLTDWPRRPQGTTLVPSVTRFSPAMGPDGITLLLFIGRLLIIVNVGRCIATDRAGCIINTLVAYTNECFQSIQHPHLLGILYCKCKLSFTVVLSLRNYLNKWRFILCTELGNNVACCRNYVWFIQTDLLWLK